MMATWTCLRRRGFGCLAALLATFGMFTVVKMIHPDAGHRRDQRHDAGAAGRRLR